MTPHKEPPSSPRAQSSPTWFLTLQLKQSLIIFTMFSNALIISMDNWSRVDVSNDTIVTRSLYFFKVGGNCVMESVSFKIFWKALSCLCASRLLTYWVLRISPLRGVMPLMRFFLDLTSFFLPLQYDLLERAVDQESEDLGFNSL